MSRPHRTAACRSLRGTCRVAHLCQCVPGTVDALLKRDQVHLCPEQSAVTQNRARVMDQQAPAAPQRLQPLRLGRQPLREHGAAATAGLRPQRRRAHVDPMTQRRLDVRLDGEGRGRGGQPLQPHRVALGLDARCGDFTGGQPLRPDPEGPDQHQHEEREDNLQPAGQRVDEAQVRAAEGGVRVVGVIGGDCVFTREPTD
eukprot:scaffold2340_cov113-Isochrysis_galbana.AAC.7